MLANIPSIPKIGTFYELSKKIYIYIIILMCLIILPKYKL